MPRPRVKPHDRLRSARACDTCKSSKKRCDGALPCNLCSRKGLADTCAYTAPSRRRRWDPHPLPSQTVAVNGGGGHGEGNILARVGLSPRDGSSSSRSVASGEADENETRLQAKQDRFTERNGAAAGNGSHSSSALPPTTTQRPVMLSSSSGEKGARGFSMFHG
ncbi:hypothetical protein VTK73DRAFT_3479 [Phialemonium thermophilum]|uniref:Zn(2)-C6 fungal-type domain-containing protein n=1 Tax=Phialemonium thermophilum TaxID=223376 RepID=A0ABR3VI29_9PEZI